MKYTEEYYAAESVARSKMSAMGWDFGAEDYNGRDSQLHTLTLSILEEGY